MSLPIEKHLDEICTAVRENPVLIVVGDTGSGKTTEIPKALYKRGFANGKKIAVTEPRVIAATSTARYVSERLGVTLGKEIGYQVRHDRVGNGVTKVCFMTDGILLREALADPNLSKYSVIMIDEAHERSENIDFLIGLMKPILARRPDLRLIIASATIDQQKFSDFFDGAPIINVSGRLYPVEMSYHYRDYSPDDYDLLADIAELAESIVRREDGDILVFLPGEREIRNLVRLLEENPRIWALPAYGGVAPQDMQKIFTPTPDGLRKVVVATNMAETSITIDGIVHVIDSGLIKQKNFHPRAGVESLDIVEHSQSGCDQRKGRAGRTRPGKCYRMLTRENFERRARFTTPEILRSNLSSLVLRMEDVGIDPLSFDFIDSPDRTAIISAYELLVVLGAINKENRTITELGRKMAQLPLEPILARMVLESIKHGCVSEIVTIAAVQDKKIFARPKDKEQEARRAHSNFAVPSSDALTMLNVWRQYVENGKSASWCFDNFLISRDLHNLSKDREQLINILVENGIEISSCDDEVFIRKAVSAGLIHNLAMLAGHYEYAIRFAKIAQVGFIHPGSVTFGNGPRCLASMALVSSGDKLYMRGVTEVEPDWLPEIAPQLFKMGAIAHITGWDEEEGKITALRQILDSNGNHFQDVYAEISLAEATEHQRKNIAEAERNGCLRVKVFKKGLFDWVGRVRGKEYRVDNAITSRLDFICGQEAVVMCKLSSDGIYPSLRVEAIIFPFMKEEEPVVVEEVKAAIKKEAPPPSPPTPPSQASLKGLLEKFGKPNHA